MSARFRVLPRKLYGLAVIESEAADYSRGDRSLRQVAWEELGERTPAHTTSHGWSDSLGAYALGRPAEFSDGPDRARWREEATVSRLGHGG